ncbi:MAG: threonine--tRNA ligase [Alphaproteobacteria bacterium]|nr:threonine--tRNA ligase [Alphaproteobacteria bacterium]
MHNDLIESHDHRHIAQRMGLLHFDDAAPGMVFWHPRGFALYQALEEHARRRILRDGYQEVRTPQLLREGVWQSSGHWQQFDGGMFRFDDHGPPAALKPVSCPGHIRIVQQDVLSYRALPLRLAEFGLVHRDERSGSILGLLRLRQFTQDDGHIFCAPDQIVGEVARFCRSLLAFYEGFGFDDVHVALSLRPEGRLGDDAVWDAAEGALREGAQQAALDVVEQPGEGAFYGPKIEFLLPDHAGKRWQCGTIQLDLVMPERFGLRYVDAEGQHQAPAMLHRALFGSLERFLGLLLERYAGQLPVWICPEQVVVLPVGEGAPYAAHVFDALRAAGVRARLDDREERLGRRVAEAHAAGVPVQLVVGARERASRAVNVRRGRRARQIPLEEAIESLAREARPPV